MRNVNRGKIWGVAALAVACLVLVQVGGVLAEGSAGREFSRCIQSCNETRKICGQACRDDCRAIYPDDTAMRDACTESCNDTCVANSQECKQTCQNIKNPPSPEEP